MLLLLIFRTTPIGLVECYKKGKKEYYIPRAYQLRGDFLLPCDLNLVYKLSDLIVIRFRTENPLNLHKKYTVYMVRAENRSGSICGDKNLNGNCKFRLKEAVLSFSLSDTTFDYGFSLKKDEFLIVSDGIKDHFLVRLDSM